MLDHTCPNCGIQFTTSIETKRYCTKKCKEQAKSRRANAKKKEPQTYCENCGAPKGTAKGKYCSRTECHRLNYWAPRGGEAAYQASLKKRQLQQRNKILSGPRQGPMPMCRNCGVGLTTFRARYCLKTDCQRAAKRDYRQRNKEQFAPLAKTTR